MRHLNTFEHVVLVLKLPGDILKDILPVFLADDPEDVGCHRVDAAAEHFVQDHELLVVFDNRVLQRQLQVPVLVDGAGKQQHVGMHLFQHPPLLGKFQQGLGIPGSDS